jgi:hypothetical protein
MYQILVSKPLKLAAAEMISGKQSSLNGSHFTAGFCHHHHLPSLFMDWLAPQVRLPSSETWKKNRPEKRRIPAQFKISVPGM